MRRALAPAAVVAACVLASAAGAGGSRSYPVRVGDFVYIKGSHVACSVGKGKEVEVSCFLLIHNGQVRKTYATVLGSSFGVIVQIVKGGHRVIVVRKNRAGKKARSAAAEASPSGHKITVGVGDQFGVAGTRLVCLVEKTQLVGVSCLKTSSQGRPVVGTYAVSADDGRATLLLTTSSKGSGDFKVVAQKYHFGKR